MYDPAVGRFLSEDPSEFDSGDMNLYRYCRNNPINTVDPTGLCGQSLARDFSSILSGDAYSSNIYASPSPGLGSLSGWNSFDTYDFGGLGTLNHIDANPGQSFSSPMLTNSDIARLSATVNQPAPLTPIMSSNVFGRQIGTAVGDGTVIYHVDGKNMTRQQLDKYIGPSTAPSTAEEALFLIGLRGHSYQADIEKKVNTMLASSPPVVIKGGLDSPDRVIAPTAQERKQIATLVANNYIGSVAKILSTHSDAKPAHGERNRIIETLGLDKTNPVCTEWANMVNMEMNQNKLMSTQVVYGGETVRLDSVLRIELAQTNNGVFSGVTPRYGQVRQHNYNVISVVGYKPKLGVDDPNVTILDPWPTLLPNAYSTKEHGPITNTGISHNNLIYVE